MRKWITCKNVFSAIACLVGYMVLTPLSWNEVDRYRIVNCNKRVLLLDTKTGQTWIKESSRRSDWTKLKHRPAYEEFLDTL